MKGNVRKHRPLAMERLEPRILLAGNVKVTVPGGGLYLRGDNAHNAVIIRQLGKNKYEVEGINDRDGNPTSINGVPNGTKVLRRVRTGFKVDLRGGDDVLGVGNNDIALQQVLAELNNRAAISSGDSQITKFRVGRQLRIKMGAGNDAVALFAKVHAKARINLGSGENAIAVAHSHFNNLNIVGRNRSDRVEIHDSRIKATLKLSLGDGTDKVNIGNSRTRRADIKTGASADGVHFAAVRVKEKLKVSLDAGDDSLSMRGTIAKEAVLRGGSGHQTFSDLGGNELHKPSLKGFAPSKPAVRLSKTVATPGQILSLTGVAFDRNAETLVTFTGPDGSTTHVKADVIDNSRADVVVPWIFDVNQGTFGSGLASVSVTQSSGTSRHFFSSANDLRIEKLPETGVSPGTVTLALLSEFRAYLKDTERQWEIIEQASPGAIDFPSLKGKLQDLQLVLSESAVEIEQLIDGRVERLDYGSIGATEVFLRRDNLAMLDRLYASLLQSDEVPATPASTPTFAHLSSAALPASAKGFFHSITCDAKPSQVFKTYNKLGASVSILAQRFLGRTPGHKFALGVAIDGLAIADAIRYSAAAQVVCHVVYNRAYDPDFLRQLLLEVVESTESSVAKNAIESLGFKTKEKWLLGLIDTITTGSDVAEVIGVESLLEHLSAIRDQVSPATISIKDVKQKEGDSGESLFKFDVELSKPRHRRDERVLVEYSTGVRQGTAIGEEDYKSVGLALLDFGPPENEKTINIQVIGDGVPERDDVFFVDLVSAKFVESGEHVNVVRGQAVGTIVNDDPQVLISTGPAKAEGNKGEKTYAFTVKLSERSQLPVEIRWSTYDGTATAADRDYIPVSGKTLTIKPGDLTATISVKVRGDKKVEANEYFYVRLISATNGTIPEGKEFVAAAVINDDKEKKEKNKQNDPGKPKNEKRVARPGEVVVTVVGNGFVTDSSGQIDTRVGRNVAKYGSNDFPFLSASSPFVEWSDPSFYTPHPPLTPSDFANGLNITASFF